MEAETFSLRAGMKQDACYQNFCEIGTRFSLPRGKGGKKVGLKRKKRNCHYVHEI